MATERIRAKNIPGSLCSLGYVGLEEVKDGQLVEFTVDRRKKHERKKMAPVSFWQLFW